MTDIGSTLREARLHARIDISEVEAETKIRAKYLRAMENEEWDLLPGPTFIRSFLRTYAAYLGLDARLLVDEYKARHDHLADHELTPIAPLGSEPSAPRRLLSPGLLAAIIIVALLAILFAVGELAGSGGPSSTASRTPAVDPQRIAAERAAARARARAVARARRERLLRSQVRLEIAPGGTTVVCLIDGQGHRLINGRTLRAGQPVQRFAAPLLRLATDNAQVALRVDGTPLRTPPAGGALAYLLRPGAAPGVLAGAQAPTCP